MRVQKCIDKISGPWPGRGRPLYKLFMKPKLALKEIKPKTCLRAPLLITLKKNFLMTILCKKLRVGSGSELFIRISKINLDLNVPVSGSAAPVKLHF